MAGMGDIGMQTGQDWQNISGGLSDMLKIGDKKEALKNNLLAGALQYTGLPNFIDSMFGNPPPQNTQTNPVVPPNKMGSNIGQSLNQFPQSFTNQMSQPQQVTPVEQDPASLANSIIPGIKTSLADFATMGDGIGSAIATLA